MEASELIIVIPAYEPNHLLAELIDKLNQYFTGHKMIVVDDGSKDKDIFSIVEKKENVIVLHHDQNRGKGAALKTGFHYIQNMEGNHIIVTADSDGQHKPEDIYRVYNFYKRYNYGIVLGSRKFDCDIPARSAFGNNAARFLLRLCEGKRLNDTQTGLRAFGNELLPFLTKIEGNRYEYEMTMLTLASMQNIAIHEIAIETIYIDNNSSSHFRPVRDFSRICSVILKYTLPLFVSILIYILGFIFMYLQFKRTESLAPYRFELAIAFSMIFAWLMNLLMHLTGLFNGNRYIFKNKRKILFYLLGSILLMGVLYGISYGLNYWWGMPILAFSIGLILSFILLSAQVFFMADKSKLNED